MTITVKVKTGRKSDSVLVIANGSYEVSVKVQPVDGKANDAIVTILATHFNISKTSITLQSGFTSKIKRFLVCLD
jgi:uncharacterized protein YggU (UPF0235/DUF167 family)